MWIHVPGGAKQDSARCQHAAENGMQLKTSELFISGIPHLIFLDCSSLQITMHKEVLLQFAAESKMSSAHTVTNY